MSKQVSKIVAKHNLKPLRGSKGVYAYQKKDTEVESLLLNARSEYIQSFVQSKSQDADYINSLLTRTAKTEVSRNYSSLKTLCNHGYEVLWGRGGHQNKRAKELNQKGVAFLWVDCEDE